VGLLHPIHHRSRRGWVALVGHPSATTISQFGYR
jgi:hypothetical protein